RVTGDGEGSARQLADDWLLPRDDVHARVVLLRDEIQPEGAYQIRLDDHPARVAARDGDAAVAPAHVDGRRAADVEYLGLRAIDAVGQGARRHPKRALRRGDAAPT